MKCPSNILHAVVTPREHGMLEARLVGLRIVVCGQTTAHLMDEFANAIKAHYAHAKKHGLTPFANLFLSDAELSHGQPEEDMGEIQLPAHISEALAIAIHASNPSGLHIKSIRQAA